jgi:chromosome segregation ATPase
MNPETVTIPQLTSSLTVKHWVGATIIVVTALGGVFTAGQMYSEARSSSQHASLAGQVALLQQQLDAAQANVQSLSTEKAQLQSAYQKAQDVVMQKTAEVNQLSTKLGRSNNCAFIYKQIIETQKELDRSPKFLDAFAAAREEQEKSRRSMLEKRVEGYQQQLASCNK